MSTPNPHETAAREEKCRKLARSILAETAIVLRREIADEAFWRNLAHRAQVNLPSQTSRERVIEILEGVAI